MLWPMGVPLRLPLPIFVPDPKTVSHVRRSFLEVVWKMKYGEVPTKWFAIVEKCRLAVTGKRREEIKK